MRKSLPKTASQGASCLSDEARLKERSLGVVPVDAGRNPGIFDLLVARVPHGLTRATFLIEENHIVSGSEDAFFVKILSGRKWFFSAF